MSSVAPDARLEELAERRKRSMEEGQVDNSRLFAGSPMYFYCRHCGVQTDVKPETYTDTPKTICDDCQGLLDEGVHDGETPSFPVR